MLNALKSVKNLPPLRESHHGVQSIAIDAGSTETRGVIVLNDGVELSSVDNLTDVEFARLLSVNSGYASISAETQLGRPSKYDSLADKLEYLIVKESGGDLGWTKQRILKASLMEASARSVSKVASSLLKTQQSQTYINIIATIANVLLSKSVTDGKAFREVMDIDLSLALPYEDIYAAKSLEEFKEKLSGVYKVIFPRLPVDKVNADGKLVDAEGNACEITGKPAKKIPYFVKFKISQDRIFITSEQNAVAEYYSAVFDDEIQDEQNNERTVIIDVGGRNTAMLLDKQSGMDESIQMTFDDGGSGLIKDIRDSAIKHFDLTTVSEDQALQALTTGKMSYGGKTIDCLEIVNAAKQRFAKTLYENYTQFLDSYSTKVNSIRRVVVSGRSFKSITENQGDAEVVLSPSIKTYFEQCFDSSIHTEVLNIGVEYPIPWGLIQARIGKLDSEEIYNPDFDFDLDFDV